MAPRMFDQMLDDASTDPLSAPQLPHVNMPQTGKSGRRLIRIEAYCADANQFGSVEGADEEFAGLAVAFAAVEPLLSQAMKKAAVVGFGEHALEQRVRIVGPPQLDVTGQVQGPVRTRFRTSSRRGGRCSGCSASNGSSTAALDRR